MLEIKSLMLRLSLGGIKNSRIYEYTNVFRQTFTEHVSIFTVKSILSGCAQDALNLYIPLVRAEY